MPGVGAFLGGPWGQLGMLGLGFLGASHAPNADMAAQQRFRWLSRMGGPNALGVEAKGIYDQFMNNSAFAQRGILQGANAAQSGIASGLAARGLGTTGIGAVSMGLGNSLAQSGLAGLRAQGWATAFPIAQQNLYARLGMANQFGGPGNNMRNSMYGAVLGAGANWFDRYLQQKYGLTGK